MPEFCELKRGDIFYIKEPKDLPFFSDTQSLFMRTTECVLVGSSRFAVYRAVRLTGEFRGFHTKIGPDAAVNLLVNGQFTGTLAPETLAAEEPV